MRRRVLLLLLLAGVAPCHAAEITVPREVLAFYYGWYGTPSVSGSWRHWEHVDPVAHDIANTLHYPASGPYDSHDPAVVERQAQAAERAGITGLIVSWWGIGSFEDQGVKLMLAAAARHHLKLSIYLETVQGPTIEARRDGAIAGLRYILTRYGRDPAWLTVGGRPVVFVYNPAFQLAGIRNWPEIRQAVVATTQQDPLLIGDWRNADILKWFDAMHRYDINRETAGRDPAALRAEIEASDASQMAMADGRIASLTIEPGHDVSKVKHTRDPFATGRMDGATYRILWQQAIAADPDWILIVSWNEWHEGSEIEPSVELGSRALDATSGFARQFLALPARRHAWP